MTTKTKLLDAANPASPIIHGWRNDLGIHRVDVALRDTVTTKDVFWSLGFNSYVLATSDSGEFFDGSGRRFGLFSVNGAGEVRWPVFLWEIEADERHEEEEWWDAEKHGEKLAAARHFHLIP